ncbi:MAG: hypothetical protein N2116_03685 [Armatimonadetes bacterium]|nr:hypothetical protein [Armatimonadota bacterium]
MTGTGINTRTQIRDFTQQPVDGILQKRKAPIDRKNHSAKNSFTPATRSLAFCAITAFAEAPNRRKKSEATLNRCPVSLKSLFWVMQPIEA